MDKKDSDNLPDVYQATKVTDEVAKVLKTTLMPVATTVTILTASPIFSLLGAVASAFIAFQASSGLSYRLDRIEEFVHQTDDAVKNLDLSRIIDDLKDSNEFRDFLEDVIRKVAKSDGESKTDFILSLLLSKLSLEGDRTDSAEEYLQLIDNLTDRQAFLAQLIWEKYSKLPYLEMMDDANWSDRYEHFTEIVRSTDFDLWWFDIACEFFGWEEFQGEREVPSGMELRARSSAWRLLRPITDLLKSYGVLIDSDDKRLEVTPFFTALMSYLRQETYDSNIAEYRKISPDDEERVHMMNKMI